MGEIELAIELIGKTDLALFVFDGIRTVWIPKSQILDPEDLDDYNYGECFTITIPEWLALEKEMI